MVKGALENTSTFISTWVHLIYLDTHQKEKTQEIKKGGKSLSDTPIAQSIDFNVPKGKIIRMNSMAYNLNSEENSGYFHFDITISQKFLWG